jgi:phthalate 4,5-dioxygenase oxygenase subunit
MAESTHWLRPSEDKSPRLRFQTTNYGFRYAAIRRPIVDPETQEYVRVTTYVAPFTALIPPNSSYNVTSVIVPRDDVSSYFHFICWGEPPGWIDQEAWRAFNRLEVGIDVDDAFRPICRNAENKYGQDRQAMKLGDFTGITGIPNQDIAMWESMGPIVDRTSEMLGTSDIAIARFRRLMVDAARRFASAGTVIGQAEPHIPQAKLCSYQGIVPKNADWRLLGASAEECAVLQAMEPATLAAP